MDGSNIIAAALGVLRVHSVREDGPDFLATTEDGRRVRITQSLGWVEVRESPGIRLVFGCPIPGVGRWDAPLPWAELCRRVGIEAATLGDDGKPRGGG